MKLRQNLNWLLEQYIRKAERLEQDAADQMVGVSCLTGQLVAYKKVIRDLHEILEEGEDE